MATELTPGLYVVEVRQGARQYTALAYRPTDPDLDTDWLARRLWMVLTNELTKAKAFRKTRGGKHVAS